MARITARKDSRVASCGSSRCVAAEAKACDSMSRYFLSEIKRSPVRKEHISGWCQRMQSDAIGLRRTDFIGTLVLRV